ncbi:MAG TPA: hypothetical protein VGJ86_07585 [Acidimicrobiales bacterium]|jgi:hypothetical protein
MSIDTAVRAPARWVSAKWLGGPLSDTLFALLWVPFAVAALAADDHPALLTWLVAATLTFSFMHQPLTLWLVYGDSDQLAGGRRLFTWTPPVTAMLVVAGLLIAPIAVVLVAGIWNAAHTLRQRYGITRIYGRMAGQTDGRAEHAMLWSWFALTVVLVAANPRIGAQTSRSGIAGRNRAALDHLNVSGTVAVAILAAAVIAAAVLTGQWLRAEANRPATNPAKWLYLGSTSALLVMTVANPIAGFMGYVGSRAAEYLVIVHRRVGQAPRSPGPRGRGPLYGFVGTTGPTAFIVTYLISAAAVVVILDRIGNRTMASAVALLLGGLHHFYNGLIWKLRRPEVATALLRPGGGG